MENLKDLDPQFHVLHSRAWRCAHYLKELGKNKNAGEGGKQQNKNGVGMEIVVSGGLSLSLVVFQTRLLIMNGIVAYHQVRGGRMWGGREKISCTTGCPMKSHEKDCDQGTMSVA